MSNTNLSAEDKWKRACKYFRYYPEVGISLDISRVQFPDTYIDSMQADLSRAFSDMRLLESGGVANPDEKRMVGHYWLRAPELSPSKEIRAAIESTNAAIHEFAKDIRSGKILSSSGKKFTDVIQIGIGGSALGPQLVSQALSQKENSIRAHFCDNTDPDGLDVAFSKLPLDSTLVLVVSKSGGTVETRNGMLEAAAVYEQAKIPFQKHFVAITCPGSNLEKQAISEGWFKIFHMWDWVGGRTSVLSAVGLLIGGLEGINTAAMLDGARAMDVITRKESATENPAALLALMWHYVGKGHGAKDMVVLPYKDRLVLFSKYLQQLVMESIGKDKNLKGETVHQGIAVYGNKGSTDQHAYVQQLRDGLNNFFATFVEVLRDFPEDPKKTIEVKPGVTSGDYLVGFLHGTREALSENARESITLTLDEVSPQTLGALIALYERTVSFYASLVHVNAYHQPGVEAGKKAAERVIAVQQQLLEAAKSGRIQKGKDYSVEELSSLLGADGEKEALFRIAEHLSANPNRGVTRSGTRGPVTARYRFS